MGIEQGELSEFRNQRENLIETNYVGEDSTLVDTSGEAFLDVPNNQWKYRPFGSTVSFHNVDAKDIDCANDGGWLRGEYLGAKNIPKVGKATWSEREAAWIYKPKGLQKTFVVPEIQFKMKRDEDVFDKAV